MPKERLEERDALMLYALIRLQQTEPKSVRALAQAAAGEEAFASALSAARGEVAGQDGGATQNEGAKDETHKEFLHAFAVSKPLREFLTRGWLKKDDDATAKRDALSKEDALKVSTFARIADITPTGEKEVFNTQDGPFLNALSAVLDRRMTPSDAERLVSEDLGRLLTLAKNSPELAEALDELEPRPHWHVVLASVEDKNDEYVSGIEGTNEQESRALRAAARDDLEKIKKASQSSDTKLGPTFRLSRMPRSLFRLARAQAQLLADIPFETEPRVDNTLDPAVASMLTVPPQPRGEESIGADALARLRSEGGTVKEEVEWVVAGVRLRIAAARHLISDREFAKLDACEYKWPNVMAKIVSGPAGVQGIRDVESHFLNPPSGVPPGTSTSDKPPPHKTEEERELYEACMNDAGLRRFLRMRPYFEEMDSRRLLERRLSFTFEPGSQLTPAATTTTATSSTAADQTRAADTQKTPTETPREAGPLDVSFVIRRKEHPQEVQEESQSADAEGLGPAYYAEGLGPAYYSVEVVMANDRGGVEYPAVRLSTRDVVRKMFASRPFTAEGYRWFLDLSKSLTHESDSEYQVTLAGRTLFDEFFGRLFPPEPIDEDFVKFLLNGSGGRRLRVTIRTDASEVARLPWEMLKTPGWERSLPLNPEVSLCRYVGEGGKAPVLRTDLDKLRLMTVFSSNVPDAAAAESRRRSVEEMFKAVDASIDSIKDTAESGRAFLQMLPQSKPHVLHLETHFTRSYLARDEPFLDLGGDRQRADRSATELGLSEFGSQLIAAGVQLVTFGYNPSGGFFDNHLLDMVNGLLRAGLPAVVAPTRPVEETSSVNFWMGFYRAWLNGMSVEDAVSRARLQTSRNDWSAFALFGSPSVVGRLRLPRAL